jgi:hypothetical protein
MAEIQYRRLPGRGVRRQGIATAARTRLWLGNDHLLLVDSMWYAEDYKRFYFRDIQAVIIRKTPTGKTVNIVLGALAVLPLAAALTLTMTSGIGYWAAIFWWIISAILLGFLLANTLLGPTCVCHLKTAVQTEELPSLRRLRRAHKVLARVRPFIVAAQGEFAPGELAARLAQPAASNAGVAPASDESYIVPFDPPLS